MTTLAETLETHLDDYCDDLPDLTGCGIAKRVFPADGRGSAYYHLTDWVVSSRISGPALVLVPRE